LQKQKKSCERNNHTVLNDTLPGVFIGGSMEYHYIHWFGQSAFRIEDGSLQVYIDPFKLPEGLPIADVILITHAHFDHFSMEDISKIKADHTMIVAPKDVASQFVDSVLAVVPGKDYTIGPLKVTTVPAYNIDKKFHPKEKKWVGYIITLADGQKIYHAGDTDFIPEMRAIVTDIAMLPCDGTYTMTAKQAAKAANSFKPKVLIPMHFGEGLGSVNAGEDVKKLFDGETVFITKEK
jgi:L-ascorbate metabolism protein UlaG (beta-lactamase superfamily)